MATDVDTNDARISELKNELKQWERWFAKTHDGRKAAREDIKNDANISAKYSEYALLRGRKTKAKTVSTPQKKAKIESADALKERALNVVSATPSKGGKTKDVQAFDPPALAQEQPTPAIVRCALGPTPQKDGEVLGIFDMLPNATPSKGNDTLESNTAHIKNGTPSKPTAPASSEQALSRTPQSSSKRFYLDAFAGTPLKRKREDETYTPSTAKRQYATPSFLRRSFPLARIDEESHEAGASAPPFKKGLVRSLSSIIQGLKKQEEEKMDDDWEIMNEIEAEERGEIKQPSAPKVLVDDSQAVDMPLGPDQGRESSVEASDADPGALDANGKPRKVWKKKGLKRQTRRVIMRPVSHKPKKANEVDRPASDESESEAVAETQQAAKRDRSVDGDDASEDSGEDSDYRHDSQQSQHETKKEPAKKRKNTKKNGGSGDKTQEHSQAEQTGTSSKKKKVSAQAHANFRKLKIKNKNSKANGRGRFGRR